MKKSHKSSSIEFQHECNILTILKGNINILKLSPTISPISRFVSAKFV